VVLPTPLEVPATTIVGTFGGMPATGRKSYDGQLYLETWRVARVAVPPASGEALSSVHPPTPPPPPGGGTGKLIHNLLCDCL